MIPDGKGKFVINKILFRRKRANESRILAFYLLYHSQLTFANWLSVFFQERDGFVRRKTYDLINCRGVCGQHCPFLSDRVVEIFAFYEPNISSAALELLQSNEPANCLASDDSTVRKEVDGILFGIVISERFGNDQMSDGEVVCRSAECRDKRSLELSLDRLREHVAQV